jgi:hypothetical protein
VGKVEKSFLVTIVSLGVSGEVTRILSRGFVAFSIAKVAFKDSFFNYLNPEVYLMALREEHRWTMIVGIQMNYSQSLSEVIAGERY